MGVGEGDASMSEGEGDASTIPIMANSILS